MLLEELCGCDLIRSPYFLFLAIFAKSVKNASRSFSPPENKHTSGMLLKLNPVSVPQGNSRV